MSGHLNLPRVGKWISLTRTTKTEGCWADVYVQRNATSTQATSDCTPSNVTFDVGTVIYSLGAEEAPILPEGPYFLDINAKKLLKAYRLYDDTQQAFLQPLAGVRIGIKDLFDLKGMKTSGGNRAYFATVQAANETAPAVQKLIDAGAIVIGKNKLSEFAWAGAFHMDHIDYLLPFNPRGDGYNSPADSSGGGGASVASYDWLDLALGSDTGGSVRGPAAYNGVHGNRPSQGAVDLQGAIPFSQSMDTAGLLARDPRVWADAIEVLYSGTIQNHTDFPSTVFVNAEDLPGTDEEYQAKVEDIYWKFGLDLASAIGANVTNFTNLDVTWNKTRPAEFNDTQLFNIYNPVYRSLVVYEQATTFGLPFLADYKSTHNGALPYVAPQTLNGWESSVQTVNETRHRTLLSQKAAIARWAADHLFKADPASCADSLLITYYGPGFDAKPAISDADRNPSVAAVYAQVSQLTTDLHACRNNTTTSDDSDSASAADIWRLASIADLPMSIVTLGDFVSDGNYTYSNVTRQKQRLPFSVGLTTRKGCDFVLSRVVRALAERGVVRTVAAGASVEFGGEVGL
ncbi:hypothetical protein SLS57_006692 [Botryosphaeria dothidea]